MIHARKLLKYYGPHLALDRIDIDIEAGQVVGFLGPNGAGKTTTLRILTGYMPPTSGSATVNGFDVFNQSLEARRSIGYLPEMNPLYMEMRVREQLHYFGKLHGMDRPTRSRRISELTDRCGLSAILSRPIGQLSKGNRQRVGLAQALLHDPPVLILDEPTIGLDPSQISEIRGLIQSLAEKKTVMLSTHILPEVERSCQSVIIIASGRIVARGTPSELRNQVQSGSRVIVEVRAPQDDVQNAFGNIEHVGSVDISTQDGWIRAAITPRQLGEDIRELLGDVVLDKRWPVRTMHYETASLEEFFIQATNAANIAAA